MIVKKPDAQNKARQGVEGGGCLAWVVVEGLDEKTSRPFFVTKSTKGCGGGGGRGGV
jgi:hypothetical protein